MFRPCLLFFARLQTREYCFGLVDIIERDVADHFAKGVATNVAAVWDTRPRVSPPAGCTLGLMSTSPLATKRKATEAALNTDYFQASPKTIVLPVLNACSL